MVPADAYDPSVNYGGTLKVRCGKSEKLAKPCETCRLFRCLDFGGLQTQDQLPPCVGGLIGGYGQPQGGYGQEAGVDAAAAPTSQENPYSGVGDNYGYAAQQMNPMYNMNAMMYGGQGGGQGNEMYYGQMPGAPQVGPGMAAGNQMFNPNMMGMGMGGPMGMGGMGMSGGYNPIGGKGGGDDQGLADQFGGMGVSQDGGGHGGKGGGGGRGGGGRGRGGGHWEGHHHPHDGKGGGKGGGKGYMHGMGGFHHNDGRGRGGYGKGGGAMGGFEDRGKRDEERDRERARNGVRGLRSGGFGMAGTMGPPVHTPEVMRLKETINPPDFEINPKYARFFVIKSYSEDDVHKSIKYGVWASTDTGNRRLDQAMRETGKKVGPLLPATPDSPTHHKILGGWGCQLSPA